VRLHESNVRFASAEDVIIHKLFAGRPRDLEDVRGILGRHPVLDTSYIRRWLKILEEGTDKPLLSTLTALAREEGLQL
jgi:hypothetical protein